jgi:OmpA-OmpF porin, OOP family
MNTNLFSQLSKEFSGDVVSNIAGSLGEDSSKTQTAVGGALQAIIGGLVNKASTRDGASDLLDLFKRNNFDGTRYTNAASAVSGLDSITRLVEIGSPLLNSIFGTRANTVVDWLSSFAGIRKPSATSMLGLVMPIVLGNIGKLLSSGGWNVSNLMSLLSDQKSYLQSMPSGLANALGFSSTDYTASERERRPPTVAAYTREPERTGIAWWKWVLPLLLLLALIPLLARLLSGREEGAQTNIAQPTATATLAYSPTATPRMEATPIVRPELGAFIDKRLPNGTTLRIPTNGVESRLIAFIEDPTRRADKETWFSFDRLEFETDSATLRPSSQEQLRNIAEIMKAYPNVNAKIGGYTDNVGEDAYNMKLSTNRARNTEQEIVKLGVNDARLDAEGYGEQHPVADNATEEGRQRNRRIDIRVTKK